MLLRMGNDAFLFKISDTVPVMDIVEKEKCCMMVLMMVILTSSCLNILSHN